MRPPASAPQAVLDAGLALTFGLLVATVALRSEDLFSAMLAAHMLLRIHDGRFAGWRKVSWLVLVLVQFALVADGFLGYVLPWGQLSFWLAARTGIFFALGPQNDAPLLGLLSWASLAIDVFALHAVRLRRRNTWMLIGLAALALAVPALVYDVARLIGAGPATPEPTAAPAHIVPNLAISATFAVVRCVESKWLGVTLFALVLLLPAAAAVTRGSSLHAPSTAGIWGACVAGLALCWIGLALLGQTAPSEPAQWIARALVVYQVVFFLAVPAVLARRAMADEHRGVFD